MKADVEFSQEPTFNYTIEERIRMKAREYGIDENLAVNIARCESDLDPGAKNPYSSAGGLFQDLTSTWLSTLKRMGLPENLDRYDAQTSIMVNMWLLSTDGSGHWNESKYCWG